MLLIFVVHRIVAKINGVVALQKRVRGIKCLMEFIKKSKFDKNVRDLHKFPIGLTRFQYSVTTSINYKYSTTI